jgi:hypothetical protein
MTTKSQIVKFAIANKKQVDVCGPMIAVEWSKGVWYHFRANHLLNDTVSFVTRYSHKTEKYEKNYGVICHAINILGRAQMLAESKC